MMTRAEGSIPSVAVVGMGYWGPNLVRVLSERTDVEVRWICDEDIDRLSRLNRRYPAIQATPDIDDVLSDPTLDGVLLATPVFSHYELGRRSLEAGKHTFIEKPLAPSSEQALELMELSVDRNLVLMCGHTFLFSPPVRAVRSLIERGDLGELFFISSSRVNLGLHQRDVSVIWDLGPHDFSILLSWLGAPPVGIRATGRDSIVRGIADVAFVTMEFESGLVANVELSWLAPSKLRRTVVVGSDKMVVYEDGTPEPLKVYDRGVVYKDPQSFGEYHLSYRTGDIVSPHLSGEEPLGLQCGEFLSSIRRGESNPANLALPYDVVRIAEAAQASLDAGGELVTLHDDQIPTHV